MRVAIDTQTVLGQKSGFGFYVKNLAENLRKISPEDEYVLIEPESKNDLSTLKRFMWDQIGFPKIAKKNKVDILHQPCFSAPIFYRGKVVVTAHDIMPIKMPQTLPLIRRFFYSKWMPYTYRAADVIITDSEWTKKDLVKHLKISPEKIKVIYLAAASSFHPILNQEKIKATKKKYKTGDKYFIHIGTIEPKKNLPFLIRAYAEAIKEGIEENLVIVGKKGWYCDELFELVSEFNLSPRVIFTGYGEDDDIQALYCGSTAHVFPSLYEGFGLTLLEAMACGTPVISSNTSSLPEVVGEAGILLPPDNEKIWAEKMVEISKNKRLAEELSEKGLKQAKKFSWEKTAQETLKVYREVLK